MDRVVEHFFFCTQMDTEDIQVLQKLIAFRWLSKVTFQILCLPPIRTGAPTPGLGTCCQCSEMQKRLFPPVHMRFFFFWYIISFFTWLS